MPLDDLVFFIDRSVGSGKAPEALRAAGARIEIHFDHFAHDCEDATWLEDVGRRGWAVITADQKIKTRRLERAALRAAGVRAFVLVALHGARPRVTTDWPRVWCRVGSHHMWKKAATGARPSLAPACARVAPALSCAPARPPALRPRARA